MQVGASVAGEFCDIPWHLFFTLDVFSFHFDSGFVHCWNGVVVEELSKIVLAHLKLFWSPLMIIQTTLDTDKYQI